MRASERVACSLPEKPPRSRARVKEQNAPRRLLHISQLLSASPSSARPAPVAVDLDARGELDLASELARVDAVSLRSLELDRCARAIV